MGRPTPPTNDTVGHWTLDDNAASTTVVDSGSGGNNGTAQANTNTLSTTDAIHNRAMTFNGTSDYINVGSGASLQLYTEFSMGAWVYWNGESGNYDWIISKGGSADGSCGLCVRTATDLITVFRNGGGSLWASNCTLSKNVWTHVFITKDSSDNLILYINGANVDSTTGFTVNAPSGTTSYLGAWTSGGNFFNGIIDDARIYSRVLSASDVAALYQAGRHRTGDVGFSKMLYPPIDQSVVGWYKLNDNAANTTVKDWTSNDNTGTAQANTSTKSTTGYTGVANTALTFNGSSDYVSISSSNLTSGNWTVSAWVKFNAFSTTSIVQDVGTSFSFGLVTYASKAGWIEGANPANSGQYMTTALSTGVWYHLVAQKNAVYVDGVSQQLSVLGFALTGSSRIGKADSYGLFNGDLSDVRIYNRTISNNEIKQLYMRGRS